MKKKIVSNVDVRLIFTMHSGRYKGDMTQISQHIAQPYHLTGSVCNNPIIHN